MAPCMRRLLGMLLERSETVMAQSPLSSLGATWVAAASLIAYHWNFIRIRFSIGTVGATSNKFVNLIMRESSVLSLCVRVRADRFSLELHPHSSLHWNSGCYLQRLRQPQV
eukprot:5907653-Amphidinium_carterae.1